MHGRFEPKLLGDADHPLFAIKGRPRGVLSEVAVIFPVHLRPSANRRAAPPIACVFGFNFASRECAAASLRPRMLGPPCFTKHKYLTRLPFFGDLFREIDFDERLIGNILLIGENLELIEHLARQSQGNRFHRSFDAGVKFDFDAVRLGKINIVRRVMKSGWRVKSCVLTFQFFVGRTTRST